MRGSASIFLVGALCVLGPATLAGCGGSGRERPATRPRADGLAEREQVESRSAPEPGTNRRDRRITHPLRVGAVSDGVIAVTVASDAYGGFERLRL